MRENDFVYYDLIASDPAKAAAFYTALCGWSVKESDAGGGPAYRHLFRGPTSVGGIGPASASAPGSAWIGYLTARDLDAAVARVRELGGRTDGPHPIPNGGRFAFAWDRQGAIFGLVQTSQAPDRTEGGAGWFVWNELGSTDMKDALAFYTALFGWNVEPNDMGGGFVYNVCKTADVRVCGIFPKSEPNAPSSWVYSISVDDVDASCARTAELGGAIVSPAVDIPMIGRYALIRDSVGAVVALFKPLPRWGAA
jgi:predicted enzyme related to lactoylglutathione lyase